MSAALGLTNLAPWMTADQFRDWPGDGTGRRYQLVDGEPVPMVHASQVHGFLQGELYRRIADHLERTGSGCRVVVAPGLRPRVVAAINVRVPDLAVTCSPLVEHFMAEPVVAIEVLSPSDQTETYGAVRAYLSLPSLREVVVISSVRVAAEISARAADGSWPADPTPVEPAGDLVIETLGFRFPLRGLYPMELA